MSITVLDSAGTPIGQGSGFLVDSKGILVTNYHVIEYASAAIAKSTTGASYKIRGVQALDTRNDLAVLRLDGDGFPFLPLGDSDKAELGDKVVAIGSPLGLDATVSDGLVSAIRTIENSTVIQTTAPISPGSSGGALLNTAGKVIGVTTFNAAGGQNLNFAVPANYIKPLLLHQIVLPFAPKQLPSPAAIASELQNQEHTAAPIRNLPREWLTSDGGESVLIRLEGDYLYEHSEFVGDGRYIIKAEDNCETKHEGDRWVGTCHRKVWLRWGSALADNICSIELREIITLVTRQRIEGEGQKLESASHPSQCPIPGVGTEKFAYIPKY